MAEPVDARTALYDEHLKLSGRIVPFAGWELPVQYDTLGPTVEHNAVRSAAGLFDIDHMGQVDVQGPDALAFLQHIQVGDMSDLPVQGARYSLMCYADGGVVDDIFVYRLAAERWWVVINASNRAKDVAWMQAHATGFDITLNDISDATYMLALQGPNAQAILQRLTPADLACDAVPLLSGDRGRGHPDAAGRDRLHGGVWLRALLPGGAGGCHVEHAAGRGRRRTACCPAGWRRSDSLRFEPCLPLYGHEIDQDIDPVSARLSWAISFAKGDFVGRDALLKLKLEGTSHLLVGFEMVDKAVPRGGYAVAVDGLPVGEVTTGMKSPTTGRFVGLAYVPAARAKLGSEIDIVIRDQPKRAVVVRRPFYLAAYRR